MTAEVKRKFNSRRGASVVLALFLLLVCTFAGTAALTAARANVGRHAGARDVQEKYLSATSAARLMIDELQKANGKISGTFDPTLTDNIEFGGLDNNSIYKLIKDDISAVMHNAVWENVHLESAWSGFEKSSHTFEEHEFELRVDGDDSFENVRITISVGDTGDGNGGNIEVTSKCGDYVYMFVMPYNTSFNKDTGKCTFSATATPEIRPPYKGESTS